MTKSEPETLSFFARIGLAFRLFFRVLFDAVFAARSKRLASGDTLPVEQAAPETPRLHTAPTEAALQLLGLLQREGRLVDFLMEDMSAYSDAEIGAAARVVHDQCKKALAEHVRLERIRSESEGSSLTLPDGFAASEIRLVGHVQGKPPFRGVLTHAGWRAIGIELPQLSEGHDVRVLAPAEVEL